MRTLFTLVFSITTFIGSILFAQSTSSQNTYVEVPQISHAGPINSISASTKFPVIATAGHEPNIYIWETTSLTLLRTLSGHGDWIDRVEFLPDGKHLVSKSLDGTVRIWDTETGKETARFGGAGAQSISDFAISPSGEHLLLTNLLSNYVVTVSTRDGAVVKQNLNFETDLCSRTVFEIGACRSIVTFSQNGNHFFAIDGLGYAIVDAETLLLKGTVQLSEELFKAKGLFIGAYPVVSGALSLKDSEGKGYLVLAFRDGRVQLRDEVNGALIWEHDLSQHFKIGDLGLRANIYYLDTGNVISVNNGGKWVQLALTDGTPIKDHPLNNVPSRLLAPINDDQLAVIIGGNTKYSTNAGKLGLYEIQRNQLVTAESRTALNFDGIAGASEAPYIVAGSHDLGAVRVFNLDAKSLISEHSLLGIRTSAVSISGDGRYVAANGQGSPGAVWDIVTDQIVRVLWDTTYTHYSVQLTDDASLVMYPAKSNDYRMAVQNVSVDGHGHGHGWIHDKSDVKFAMSVLSMDGKKIAAGTNSNGVRIYDLETNNLTGTVQLGSLAWTLASSPKSSVFAAGNHSGEVVIADWDGNELARFGPIQPHYPGQGVRTMDVSNDGKTVVVGDEGGRVCLLSVPEKSRTCFFEIGIPVDGVTFAGNDRYIAMVDRATSTYVFDVDALEHIMTIEQFADGGAIHDLRDGSITNFGKGACVETNGYEWRSCSG